MSAYHVIKALYAAPVTVGRRAAREEMRQNEGTEHTSVAYHATSRNIHRPRRQMPRRSRAVARRENARPPNTPSRMAGCIQA